MIPLRLKIDPLPLAQPLVVRLNAGSAAGCSAPTADDVFLVGEGGAFSEFDLNGFSLRVHGARAAELDGDVIMVPAGRAVAHRLIRARSRHNTFLVTEQCDQVCIMCSQPPKAEHIDNFESYLAAARLAPRDATIGLSGGEPTLHKERLKDFLLAIQADRPDLHFHILTNGQHFTEDDLSWLRRLDGSKVTWGIPLYSSHAEPHDRIVAKAGAFARLERSFAVLARAGAAIELRTIPMSSNADDLGRLAKYVSTRLPFIGVWAIMQMEYIGYARMSWQREFLDTSADFAPVAGAIDLAAGRGIAVALYNFPLCTVPLAYRHFCVRSISDWKQKYVETCEGCAQRTQCSGFFEWYPEGQGFSRVERQ